MMRDVDKMKTLTILIGFVLLWSVQLNNASASENIVISAGPKGGSFFRLGNVLCKVINSSSQDVRCSTLPMGEGDAAESFANLVNLRDGAADFAIASSDWLYFAYRGTGPVKFLVRKFDSLRSLFSIEKIPLTLIAKRNSGIENLEQLRGKRFNLGKPRTDVRDVIDQLMQVLNWNKKDFELAEEINASEQSFAFCFGRVQAISVFARHPDPGIQKISQHCNAQFVAISGTKLEQLFESSPYLSKTRIPGGLYETQKNSVNTIGKSIALVTSTDVPNDLAQSVVKILFENFDKLKTFHPAIANVDKSSLIENGITAPIHDGAREYFQSAGLLQ